MPKKPTKMKTDPWTIVFVVLILILVLKALGILKTYLNIDPNGITFTFDIGYLTSAGLFVLLWRRFEKINDRLSEQIRKQGERIAKIEGMLEKK
jgi:cytochrome c biogenesis protein CcdA